MDINNETEINKDGIYRPLKLNPMLMDTGKTMLSKKQERMAQQFKKEVKNSEIYKGVVESMTNLPIEEKFFLETKSKSKRKDMQNYEENNYIRLKQTRRELKKSQSKKRYKESSIGENLNSFVDNLDKSYKNAQRLGDFEAGGKFSDTIAKNTKKYLKGGIYIKGPWQRRQKILFKRSKKGQKVEARKKWRKTHPLKNKSCKGIKNETASVQKSAKVKSY
eukprot:UN01716